jgi:hypothetical protein
MRTDKIFVPIDNKKENQLELSIYFEERGDKRSIKNDMDYISVYINQKIKVGNGK